MSFSKLEYFLEYLAEKIFDILYQLHLQKVIVYFRQSISSFCLEFLELQYNLALQRYA